MPARSGSRRLRVAVTGFAGLEDPGAGASIAQSLVAGWPGAAAPLRTSGTRRTRTQTGDGARGGSRGGSLAINAWTYGAPANAAFLPGVIDAAHVLPSLDAGDERLFGAIVEQARRAGVDLLLPADADVALLARLTPRLAECGLRVLLPPVHRVDALARANLPKFLHDHAFAAPLTVNVAAIDEIAPVADRIGYPLFVRGLASGERLVWNAFQAIAAAQSLTVARQPGVGLQWQVPGERYSIGLVADAHSRVRTIVCVKIVAVNGEGRVVTGTTVDLAPLTRLAQALVAAAQWRGALTLEVVMPQGASHPLVIDVLPHLPNWCETSHWAGANLAVALLAETLGMRQRRATPRPGTMFLRGIDETSIDTAELLRMRREGRLERITRVNGHAHPRVARLAGADAGAVTVAITGTSTFDVINPGLGVARALRYAPEVKRIIGLSYGTLESGAYQPGLFDAVYRLPDAGDPQLLAARIEEIHRAEGIDVLMPCLDGELPVFIDALERIHHAGIRTLLPSRVAFDARAKRELFSGRYAEDWGSFAIPHSRFACSEDDAARAAEAVGLPAVVKGPLFLCFAVATADEARAAYRTLAQAGWREAIVQRRVDGAHYATSLVCGADHRALSAFSIKKLATCRRGSTWTALRARLPELEADFARFLAQLGWSGPAEGEFIRDEATDRFHLIEVNPRFTGWIYYSATLQCNQPRAALAAALGRPVDAPAFADHYAFVRRSIDVQVRPSQLAALATKGMLRHG